MFRWCLINVAVVCGSCLGGVSVMFGGVSVMFRWCLGHVCGVSVMLRRWCLGHVSAVSRSCLGGVSVMLS